MMRRPGDRERAEALMKFAILGTLEGKTPEQLADEYMDLMGWNQPAEAPVVRQEDFMIEHADRPTGWPANPQAMAMVFNRKEYSGHPELGRAVDPDTWLTPRWILDQLGAFDLDPCAAAVSPSWVGAARAYTKDVDGLRSEWSGRIFMNPPFSDTRPWIRKHSEHGQGISLVPAALESAIWRECVWTRAKALLLLSGRTRFANPDGSITTGRPLRSIALIAWSEADAAVLAGSGMAGVLLTSWNHKGRL